MIRASLVFCLGCCWVCGAWAGPPSIESISTPVIQLGKTAQIEVVGAGMRGVQELVFYSQGVRSSHLTAVDDYTLLATIEVDEECVVKSHAFRLRGEDGFSELRTLRVNRYPVTEEALRDSVQTVVELTKNNQTVSGVLESGEYDRYSIELEKGERLTAEAEAMRLGGDLLDTVLTVWDPHGKVVMVRDDGPLFGQDAVLSFTAPIAGRYIVEIRESNYGGSGNSRYLLHLGNFPPARVAYPAGAQLGLADQMVQFLEDSGQAHSDQVIPKLADADSFQLFASDEGGISASPTPFRLNECHNVLEVEPNNTIQQAVEQLWQSMQAQPSTNQFSAVALNGLLQQASDVDLFAIQAAEGQALVCEVFANRIGSPLDTYLELFDQSGRLLAQNDDCDSHDSKLEFVVPASGVYVLALRDKLHRGFGCGVYRIEVRQAQSALTAFLPRPDRISQRHQTIAVPQGNRAVAKIGVRRDNVDGEVQLRFDDLPAGVLATPVYVPSNEYWAIAVLEAESSAPVAGRLSSVVATCQTANAMVQGKFLQEVDLIAESADRLYQAAVVDRVAVAVTSALPFAIQIKQPQTGVPVHGTIDLSVEVERVQGFEAPIQITFPYLPDGCVGEPNLIIPAKQNSAIYRVSATGSAMTGGFRLAAVGTVQISDGRERSEARLDSEPRDRSATNATLLKALKDREAASNVIDLEVVPNPLGGRFLGLASEPGKNFSVACQLDVVDWDALPDQLSARLEGLPKGISTKPISVPTRASEILFDVMVAEDAPVGSFQGVQCRLSGVKNGSEVSYVIPASGQLLIAEPGKLIRSEDGSVLSPLEALRKLSGP